MRILVDMDGVLADFEGYFLQQWQDQHPEKPFVALPERTTFYIRENYPAEFSDLVHGIMCAPKFYRSLEPIPGAVEAVREMRQIGLEVFICTSPLEQYQNCVLEKFEWIDEHLGFDWITRMVLTTDKTIVRADI